LQKISAYQSLVKTFQRLSRFSHLSSIASWDMFTMMPPGGSAARGEALAEMSVLQHQILTDKKVGDLLAAAAGEDLNDVEQANLREMTRHYQQATLLPESLVEAKSLAGSRCEHAWHAASRQRLAGFFRQPERGGQTQPRRGAPAGGSQRLYTVRRAAGYF
jgi:carboxypeptidase Taq